MFTVTFKRVIDKLGDKLGDKRDEIIKHITKNRGITIPELATLLGISYKGVQYHITAMQKEGVLIRKGSRKIGYWVVLQNK